MGVTDFDFLPGSWNVHNRKLTDMLDPTCDEWEEFEATSEAEAMLGGVGNLDHFFAPGYEGFSLRLHDPERDVWQIWWSSTSRPGRLDPPVEGRFDENGDARFETEDVLDGVPIGVRFEWSAVTTDTPLWKQFFSFDGGQTWKHNWTMSFARR